MTRKTDYPTLDAYYRADGDPEGPVDHSQRMAAACGFCWTYYSDQHSEACQEQRRTA